MRFILLMLFAGVLLPGKAQIKSKPEEKVEFTAYSQKIPGSDIHIRFVPVTGGTFMMGDPGKVNIQSKEEIANRKVQLDPFWMGAYEITWDQYDIFVNEQLQHQSSTPAGGVDAITSPSRPYVDMSFGMGREGYPAINMTQHAALMYAKWLTARTGHFYRLPTEAEWEYACRAGSDSAYSFGNDPSPLNEYGWSSINSDGAYHPVGQKKPNAFGLYDMHGNVSEWVMDQFLPDYYQRLEGNPAVNPWFIPKVLYPIAVRGGSWMDAPEELTSHYRKGSDREWKKRDPQLPKSLWWLTDAPFVGFRLVRPAVVPSKEKIAEYWIKAMDDI